MFKRMMDWIFFSLLSGALPLLFRLIVCFSWDKGFVFEDYYMEIIFCSIILAATGLRDCFDNPEDSDIKTFYVFLFLFTIIMDSVLYGMTLLDSYTYVEVTGIVKPAIIKLTVFVFFGCSVVCGGFARYDGGEK